MSAKAPPSVSIDVIDEITKLPPGHRKEETHEINWHKLCSDGCSSFTMVMSFLFFLSTAIAAIVIANKYDTTSCVGSYSGILIRYDTWLKVNGIVEVVMLSVIFVLTCCALNGKKNIGLNRLIIIFVVVDTLFQICWHIVGIVLYFHTAFETCASNTTVYSFGFTMVIMKTIVYVLMIWGCWAKTLNFSQ